MGQQKYWVVMRHDFDGMVWEIRAEKGEDEAYCSHINCTFEYEDDVYYGLWSWEKGDELESNDGLPWCHFCHEPVPDGLQAIMAMLDSEEYAIWRV
jgi:hypothetical protein